MSKKNKDLKQTAISQIENPIVIQVEIETDDDFKVNGKGSLTQEIQFKTLEEMRSGVLGYIKGFEYTCHPSKQTTVNAFKEMLGYLVDEVNELGKPFNETHPEDGIFNVVRYGGNQTIEIRLVS